MARRAAELEVLGRSSLETSRRFGEGFTPAALASESAGPGLRTVFCVEGDWCRAEAEATQAGGIAHPGQAVQRVQQVKGSGPFAAELVVVCGANARCAARYERWLDAEIAERYGPGRTLAEVPEAWRSYRTWAACGRCASSAPARSPAAEPPGPPDTLNDHALGR